MLVGKGGFLSLISANVFIFDYHSLYPVMYRSLPTSPSKKSLREEYLLLQHQTGAAQLGCLDANGKAPAISGCIKSGQQHTWLLAGKTLYFFTVLLTGSGSAPHRDSCNFFQKQSGLPIRVNPCKPVSTTLFCELAQWMMSGFPLSSLPTKIPTWESPG